MEILALNVFKDINLIINVVAKKFVIQINNQISVFVNKIKFYIILIYAQIFIIKINLNLFQNTIMFLIVYYMINMENVNNVKVNKYLIMQVNKILIVIVKLII